MNAGNQNKVKDTQIILMSMDDSVCILLTKIIRSQMKSLKMRSNYIGSIATIFKIFVLQS